MGQVLEPPPGDLTGPGKPRTGGQHVLLSLGPVHIRHLWIHQAAQIARAPGLLQTRQSTLLHPTLTLRLIPPTHVPFVWAQVKT